MNKIILIVLLLAILLTGCGPNIVPTQNSTPSTFSTPTSNNVEYKMLLAKPYNFNSYAFRFYDKEAGVLCYFVVGGAGVGIDCISINDTRLPR